VKADARGESARASQLVQAGVLTPTKDAPSRPRTAPGRVGSVPQFTPVGGAPNPTRAPTLPDDGG
jgi:hypothetical protein